MDLTDEDIEELLSLRPASIRHAVPPAVKSLSASRLHAHGLVQSTGLGGVEITYVGLEYFDSNFTFCKAAGCDGIPRRWRPLSPVHAGHDGRDLDLGQPSDKSEHRCYIECPKCGSLNLLGKEPPARRSHYLVTKAIPG
jgi:hypothetical protein